MSLKSVIESMLFVYGEPLSLKKLGRFTKSKENEVKKALHELQDDYKDRGLVILEKDGEYQIGSSPDSAKYVKELFQDEFSEELSRAAVETLSIVAYRGPLTRVEIEYLRGVNSSFTLRNLLLRGLVERIDNPGDLRSYLYRISFDFLKYFGLENVENLPHYEEFRKEKIEIPDETPVKNTHPI